MAIDAGNNRSRISNKVCGFRDLDQHRISGVEPVCAGEEFNPIA